MLPRLLIGIRSRDRIAPIATALAMLIVTAQAVVSTKAAAEDFNIREPSLQSSRPVDVPGATTRPLPDTPKSNQYGSVPKGEPTNQYGNIPKGEPTSQYGNIPKGEPSSQYGSVPKGEPQYGNVPKGEPQYGSVPKGERVSQPGTAATGEAKPPTRPDQSQYQDVPTTPPQNNAPPQRNAGRPDQSQYQDLPQTPQQNTGRPNQSQYQDIPKPPVDQPGLKPRNEYGSVTPKDPYLNDPDVKRITPPRGGDPTKPLSNGKPRNLYDLIIPEASSSPYLDQAGLDELNAEAISGKPKFTELEMSPPKSTTEPYAKRPTIRKLAKWKAVDISPGSIAVLK